MGALDPSQRLLQALSAFCPPHIQLCSWLSATSYLHLRSWMERHAGCMRLQLYNHACQCCTPLCCANQLDACKHAAVGQPELAEGLMPLKLPDLTADVGMSAVPAPRCRHMSSGPHPCITCWLAPGVSASVQGRFELPAGLTLPNLAGLPADAGVSAPLSGSSLARAFENNVDASLTWSFVGWLRSVTRLPLFVKAQPAKRHPETPY